MLVVARVCIGFCYFTKRVAFYNYNYTGDDCCGAVAFKIYDINKSGAIEPPELKRFLVAIMADNPDIHLDDVALDQIVDDTFKQIDLVGDGKINPEEWMALVKRNPSIISYMTLPVLAEICRRFPTTPQRTR